MVTEITAKTLVSRVKKDSWFGLHYNMNLYRGCQHQCIYCDSRSECYRIEDFSKISVKTNAIELLSKELPRKKYVGTIGLGAMNDCYMPIEKEYQLTRKALGAIAWFKFGVHIITKSDLVLRDLDLLTSISDVYAAVSFTITTSDDDLAKKIEPGASLPSKRFEAMKILSDNGIYTGVTLMPVLPFIEDSEEAVRDLIEKAAESGAKYIIPAFGVTLRDRQREYFYQKLDKLFPGIRKQYERRYRNSYICGSPNGNKLHEMVNEFCASKGIGTRMKFFNQPAQLNLFEDSLKGVYSSEG